MKKALVYLAIVCCFGSHVFGQNLLDCVNPFIGTGASTTLSSQKHASGTENLANTIPVVGVPFGMTQWTPQSQQTEKKCLAPYYYNDKKLYGFRGTHWLSGSCTQDYGSFTITPISGKLQINPEIYAFDNLHQNEIARPNYYQIDIPAYQLKVQLTAKQRTAFFNITANATDSVYILITPNSDKNQAYIKVDQKNNRISGYNPAYRIYQGSGKPAGFSGYFVIEMDRPFTVKGVFSDNKLQSTDSLSKQKDLGAYVGFKLNKNEQLKLRVGTSFTSIENAIKNLHAEINHWDFEQIKKESEANWLKYLNKIKIEDESRENKTIFYTALYHSLQHPRLFNDVDGTYPQFDSHYKNATTKGNYYDDFSMWDIYRAQLPLLELIAPEETNDMLKSLIIKGQQAKWLPIFPCWNSITGAMIGDHATSFITSRYLKGFRDFDITEAYRLMRQNAFDIPSKEIYLTGKGRRGLESYLKYGYIPLEDEVLDAFHKREQVSRTLEYAFDDYALAMFAKQKGEKKDWKILLNRSKNYKNVFDKATGFVRGRYKNGTWYKDFNPDIKHSFITEGTSRQYMFYVPHDVNGLIKLMGGKKKFEQALDSLFKKNEYWHGNEPGHHIPFLYNYTRSPWKAKQYVHQILKEEYGNGIGGLSGNDDTGQMSAWYIFAAMGFYPVNPVSGEYQITAPLFKKVSLTLPNDRILNIENFKTNEKSGKINKIIWNGKTHKSWSYRYKDLLNGGEVRFMLD